MLNKKKCFLPAEWSPQSGVMLTWPHKKSDWGPILNDVEPVFIEIARQISLREKLLIVCFDHLHLDQVNALLKNKLRKERIETSRIKLAICQSNDSWTRDHAPICAYQEDKPLLLDFKFNGWGKKYDYDLDNRISENLSKANVFGNAIHEKIDMVLEGGSIDEIGRASCRERG